MTMATVLFVWRRYTPPFLIGGAEVSQRLLAEEFAAAGWRVVYLGSHEAPWNGSSELLAMRCYLTERQIPYVEAAGELRYRWLGIECRAVPQAELAPALTTVLVKDRPELVVTSQEGSAALAESARPYAPVAGWLHSVSPTGLEVLQGQPQYALATSNFVLSHHVQVCRTTRPVLFYPPFRPATSPASGQHRADDLLMVNPVPAKGSRLIHQLAKRMPDRRFTLLEGWWDTSAEFTDLHNVRYMRRTFDIDTVYARHRLLLVPSVVDGAFPRVIIEAGLSGLPAIGSTQGGIPEAIDNIGALVPPHDAAAWEAAIRSTDDTAVRVSMADQAHRRAGQLVRHCLPELAAAGVVTDIHS